MFGRYSARASGVLIMLLGAWGGIAPYVGPRFGYHMDNLGAWQWTTARAELSLGPGVIAILGGLLLMIAGYRAAQRFGAFMAAAAGTWFVVGSLFYPLWTGASVTLPTSGVAGISTTWMRIVEWLGFFLGTGVLIVLLAAYAYGALASVGMAWGAPERSMELRGAGATRQPVPPPLPEEPVGPNPPVVAR
jgi:hypothetical protein